MNGKSDCSYQKPMKYKKMTVRKITVVFAFLGTFIYIADIYTDLSLAVNNYYEGHVIFFYLTLFVVVISAAVSSIFSFYLYWIDNKKEELKVSTKIWIVRAVFLLLGIAPVLRNIVTLCYALKSYRSANKKEKRYYARRMIFENNDGSFLRLFEAFLEGGPQLVLQIYILLKMHTLSPNVFTATEIKQYGSMLISVMSVSVSVVAYTKSLRSSLDDKNELRCAQLLPLFIHRIFEIISRTTAMGLGISATPYLHVVFILHFIIMTVWIRFLNTDFTDHRYAEWFYNGLLAVILTFVFLNPEDSPTQTRCVYFYIGMLLENTILLVFWYYKKYNSPELREQIPAVYIQILSFGLSMIFMVIYYKFFHPTIGRLSEEKTQENNVDDSKAVINNGEASEMLKTVVNEKSNGAVTLSEKANITLDILENDTTTETEL